MEKENGHKITYRLSRKEETEIVLSLILTTYALSLLYTKCLESKLINFLEAQGWEARQIESTLLVSLLAFVICTAYLLMKMEQYIRDNYKELIK